MNKSLIFAVLTVLLLSVPISRADAKADSEIVFLPAATPETVLCGPTTAITSETTTIQLDVGELQAKFYRPVAPAGQEYTPVPGIVLSHGYGLSNGITNSYTNLEATAAALARLCATVLIHDARGHGLSLASTPPFTMYGPGWENDIVAIMNKLKGYTPYVDPERLAVLGFSQAGIQAWHVIANATTRTEFLVAIPFDGYPLSKERMLPNSCINSNLAQFVDPALHRPPCTSNCSTVQGITWDESLWNALRTAYVLTHPPDYDYLEDRIEERQITISGTNLPHLFFILSQYDTQQFVDESTATYNTVSSLPGAYGYPSKRLLVTTGGHSDDEWHAADEEALRDAERFAWLQAYLDTITQEPPWGTRSPVEYVEDSFDAVTGEIIFTRKGADAWPLAVEETSTLWLHPGGLVQTTPPGTAVAFDTLSQDFTGTTAYMSTAVTEDPYFATFTSQLNNPATASKIYTSPPLLQDVILVGPPTVELYAVGGGSTSYQVHVRVREQAASGGVAFITRANACAWEELVAPPQFTGTSFSGETRIHRFKAGSRIQLQFITYDEETYWQDQTALYLTPSLGDFTVRIDRYGSRDTNVQLKFDKTAAGPIFDTTGGLLASSQNQSQSPAAPTPTPAPEPLAMTAALYPDFTNPGGWRSWAPEVRLTCSGGVGEVDCPDTQFVFSDGISQTVSYTATDESGAVVTATLTGVTVDRTSPVLSETLPETQTFCSGSTLRLGFSVSDALSGLAQSSATFNGAPAGDGNVVSLLTGTNTLNVDSLDVAGNQAVYTTTVQVNYDLTTDFPDDGQTVNPLLPLAFAFQVNDTCSLPGWYSGAIGTLWLTGPDGVERPAEWFGASSGNTFLYNILTGWYTFDADVSSLAAGTWTARAHLDDGNDVTTTFVVPGGQGSEVVEGTTATAVRSSCQDGWLRRFMEAGYCH